MGTTFIQSRMSADKRELWDVAVSFLADDLGIAQEIRDRLSPSLKVFLYSHEQSAVAGTDGLESFRQIFREGSRLVVVVYREGWGNTRWTRVEKEAITDRFLKEGAGFLFWIMLDRTSTPPPWLPERLIRFNLEDFGIEQAVGAIKARAREAGAEFRAETPAQKAKRLQELQRFESEKSALMHSDRGVRAAEKAVSELFAAIEENVSEITKSAAELQIQSGHDQQTMIVRGKTCSVGVYWYCRYSNSLDEARLRVSEFQGHLGFPGQGGFYITEPKELATELFEADLTRDLGWSWRSSDGEHLSTKQVADRVIDKLLRNTERVARGELPSHW
jgi:hypothetical protein